MKTRFSRNEDVRRAMAHEERSSAPPEFGLSAHDNDISFVASDHESDMKAHIQGPDTGKEAHD